jgi:hypothetical protein
MIASSSTISTALLSLGRRKRHRKLDAVTPGGLLCFQLRAQLRRESVNNSRSQPQARLIFRGALSRVGDDELQGVSLRTHSYSTGRSDVLDRSSPAR